MRGEDISLSYDILRGVCPSISLILQGLAGKTSDNEYYVRSTRLPLHINALQCATVEFSTVLLPQAHDFCIATD